MEHYTTTVLFFLAFATRVSTFNLDINFPVVFAGVKNSYFGYSVAILPNSFLNQVIVGAPKANVTENPNFSEPGAIYGCNTASWKCSKVAFDINEDQRYLDKNCQYRDYKQDKKGAWMGVSLDTSEDGGSILACSHLWANWLRDDNKVDHRLTNGMCYVINGNLDPVSSTKYLPLIDRDLQVNEQRDYYYSFGQVGTSAQFVKGAKGIILGAPGIQEWKGSIALYLRDNHEGIARKWKTEQCNSNFKVPKPLSSVHYDSYFGYAVTSGVILKNQTYYIIGAPRDSFVGKVYIVDMSADGTIVEKVHKEGHTVGEYFGAAVCAVDVNGDGLDDLMVGAPFYSKSSSEKEGDEGAVYMHINEGHTRLVHYGLIMGSQVPGARFGSAIAAIGDLNLDGYQDIGIGAPYENDVGAVYIYFGSKTGLVVQHVQRISASMAHPSAKGFGCSISRGYDVDDNFYPDVAIGAYDSDQAFLFRTRPLLSLEGKIILDKGSIDMESNKTCTFQGSKVTCFKAEVCILYHGKYVPSNIDVSTHLEVDVYKGNDTKSTRAVIMKNESYHAQVTTVLHVAKDEEQCISYDVHVPIPPNDYLTPVTLKLTYFMLSSNKVKEFCKSCPVEQWKSSFEIAQIPFKKNCGHDENCDADLQLKAWLEGYNESSHLIIGATKEIILQARVSNFGEPAFMTRLFVRLPEWMQVNRKPAACDNYGSEKNNYICQVANPLAGNRSESIQLNLNLEVIPITEKVLSVNVSVNTDSNENNETLEDNEVYIEVPLFYVADMSIKGILRSEQILYDLDEKGKVIEGRKLKFSHTYELSNIQPSPVKLISVHVTIPTHSRDDPSNTLMTIYSIDTYSRQSLVTFGACDQEVLVAPVLTSALNPHEAVTINCSTAICETVVCTVGPFINSVPASLTVTLEIDPHNIIRYMGKKDTAAITTFAQVYIKDPNIDLNMYNKALDNATLTSFLMPRGTVKGALPSWVIPVSVATGLLLLVIIIRTLVKVGFFKRKQRDMVRKKMLHKGQLLSTDSLTDSEED